MNATVQPTNHCISIEIRIPARVAAFASDVAQTWRGFAERHRASRERHRHQRRIALIARDLDDRTLRDLGYLDVAKRRREVDAWARHSAASNGFGG